MIQRFHNARHWQLFLLLFVLPVVLQMITMVVIITSILGIASDVAPDPEVIFSKFSFFFLFMMVFMGLIFAWFYSIGVGLQAFIPSTYRLRTGFFKATIFVPLCYFILLFLLLLDPLRFFPMMLVLVIPLHFFTIFSAFYNLYFVAKTVKTAELQRPVSFGDYAGEFFLLWFYPVGIWFIQPKVNDISKGIFKHTERTTMSSSDLLDD